MGWSEPRGFDKEIVTAINDASELFRGKLKQHDSRGGTSERENPADSLHRHMPTKAGMGKQGTRYVRYYSTMAGQKPLPLMQHPSQLHWALTEAWPAVFQ